MTEAATPPSGASPSRLSWDAIDWHTLEKHVKRLQMRIAKAVREKRWGKVKALQWLLTRSYYAKLLAINGLFKTVVVARLGLMEYSGKHLTRKVRQSGH